MVIALMNNKGGVAKTTSVCTIAQILALGEYKVLVIDMDQQANCSRMFGISGEIEGLNYANLLCNPLRKEEVYDYIYESNFKNINILPASPQLKSMPIALYEEQKTNMAAPLAFRRNIGAISEDYDFILIDTAPGYDDYFIESIVAAVDKVLIPSEVNNTSYEGVSVTVPLVKNVNDKYGLNVEFAGIFFTRVKNRSSLYAGMNDSYKEMFGEYFMPVGIRDTIKVHESYTTFEPLYFRDKKCTAFIDYVELVGVLGIMDNKHWKNVKMAMLTNKDMRVEE